MGQRSSKIYLSTDESDEISVAVDKFIADRVEVVCHKKVFPGLPTVNSPPLKSDDITRLPSVSTAAFSKIDSNSIVEVAIMKLNSSTTGQHAGKGMKSVKSLKALASFAYKQHNKQDNSYIPAEAVAASFYKSLTKEKSEVRSADQSSVNFANDSLLILPLPTLKSGEFAENLSTIDETQPAVEDNTHAQIKDDKRISKHHHRVIQDDADWIPVSDDELDDESTLASSMSVYVQGLRALGKQGGNGSNNNSGNMTNNSGKIGSATSSNNNSGSPLNPSSANRLVVSPLPSTAKEPTVAAFKKPGGLQLNTAPVVAVPTDGDNRGLTAYQSYLFTKSGTMLVSGFSGAIGTTGIQAQAGAQGRKVDASKAPGLRDIAEEGYESFRIDPILQLPMRERFVLLCKLGQGASGAVFKALDLSEMRFVALKIIPVNERSKRRQMAQEIAALYQMLRVVSIRYSKSNQSRDDSEASSSVDETKRPDNSIVKFYDAFSALDEGGVALMMEYLDGGSLQDMVDSGGCSDEETLVGIAVQALQGLNFLHSCSQLHRDLKPGNLLINKCGEVKIADLGLLKQLESPQPTSTTEPASLVRTNTFIGTACYMSPERIDGRDYSFPSDVWALGLSLLAIATGHLPVDTGKGYWNLLQSIRDDPSPILPSEQVDPVTGEVIEWSAEFRDFVNCCLKKNPDERWTCAQLLEHPFVANCDIRTVDGISEYDGNSGYGDSETSPINPPFIDIDAGSECNSQLTMTEGLLTTSDVAKTSPIPEISLAQSPAFLKISYKETLRELRLILIAVQQHLWRLFLEFLSESIICKICDYVADLDVKKKASQVQLELKPLGVMEAPPTSLMNKFPNLQLKLDVPVAVPVQAVAAVPMNAGNPAKFRAKPASFLFNPVFIDALLERYDCIDIKSKEWCNKDGSVLDDDTLSNLLLEKIQADENCVRTIKLSIMYGMRMILFGSIDRGSLDSSIPVISESILSMKVQSSLNSCVATECNRVTEIARQLYVPSHVTETLIVTVLNEMISSNEVVQLESFKFTKTSSDAVDGVFSEEDVENTVIAQSPPKVLDYMSTPKAYHSYHHKA